MTPPAVWVRYSNPQRNMAGVFLQAGPKTLTWKEVQHAPLEYHGSITVGRIPTDKWPAARDFALKAMKPRKPAICAGDWCRRQARHLQWALLRKGLMHLPTTSKVAAGVAVGAGSLVAGMVFGPAAVISADEVYRKAKMAAAARRNPAQAALELARMEHRRPGTLIGPGGTAIGQAAGRPHAQDFIAEGKPAPPHAQAASSSQHGSHSSSPDSGGQSSTHGQVLGFPVQSPTRQSGEGHSPNHLPTKRSLDALSAPRRPAALAKRDENQDKLASTHLNMYARRGPIHQ